MTIGQKIKEVRKRKGLSGAELGGLVGTSKSYISKIETDSIKGGPEPEILIKLSEALDDRTILVHALMENPICQMIIPRAFAPLNNINDNPSAVLAKLREELAEAIEAADILSRIFSVKEPQNTPNYKETLLANCEQILDTCRCVEEMFAKFKESGAMTEEDHLEIRIRQQAKVERNGHHKKECA